MLRRTMGDVKDGGGAPALAGKNVLVTGGSSGIGRAIALACARAGADIATTYRTNAAGAEAVAVLIRAEGRRAVVLPADISKEVDLDRLVNKLGSEFDSVDAWINNAGADILTGSGAELPKLAKLDLLLAVDLRGTMLASWRAAELMRGQPKGGVIINLSWDGAAQGMSGENPQLFAAVKGGVASFSRALARSVAPRVRVNIISPGWIETAFGQTVAAGFRRRVAEEIPLRRWGTPEDVAGAAVYLASDAAGYLTGQTIMVNGGDVM